MSSSSDSDRELPGRGPGRPASRDGPTRMLVEAVGIACYRVAGDGSSAELAFVDASGAEVAVTIPQEGIGSLIVTLPTIMDQLVRRSRADLGARFVFGAADWRLELGSDGDSLILTLETADRFRVSFALGPEPARRIGQALTRGAERLTPGRPADALSVLQ